MLDQATHNQLIMIMTRFFYFASLMYDEYLLCNLLTDIVFLLFQVLTNNIDDFICKIMPKSLMSHNSSVASTLVRLLCV